MESRSKRCLIKGLEVCCSIGITVWDSLEPSHPKFFSKKAVPLFLPASEKKLGQLGTRLHVGMGGCRADISPGIASAGLSFLVLF